MRTIKELNLTSLANGADIVRSMVEAIDGDMKHVPDERQDSADLAETIESARKSLDAIEKTSRSNVPGARQRQVVKRVNGLMS
jgi:hypothetical protein